MNRPTKFEIMRINRGFTEFVNHKQEIMEKVDCCELEVLRTLRERDEQEEYPAADNQRLARVMQQIADRPTVPIQMRPERVSAEPKIPEWTRPGFLGRLWRRA